MPNRLLVTEVAVIEPVTIKPSVNVTKPDELTCNDVLLAVVAVPVPTANTVSEVVFKIPSFKLYLPKNAEPAVFKSLFELLPVTTKLLPPITFLIAEKRGVLPDAELVALIKIVLLPPVIVLRLIIGLPVPPAGIDPVIVALLLVPVRVLPLNVKEPVPALPLK